MDARQSKFAIKLLPSMTDFAFVMPIALLFGLMPGTKMLLGDCDTGWHIRTGEWILANHRVPTRDLFSFTKPGEPWYAWEWLTDVIWAGLHRWGGLALVALASVLLISFTSVIVFRIARRNSNPVVAIAITMAVAADSTLHWLARPHLFTLLFLALFCAALERVRRGAAHSALLLAALPFATVLWTNLHGGWFVGAITVGAYGAGELLNMALAQAPDERRGARGKATAYLLTAAACLGASFINPYGYRLHAHMIQYLRDPYYTQSILEFGPLDFHHPMGMFWEASLLAGAAAAFWHASRRRFIAPLVIVGWGHAALLACRNLPIFAVAAAPFIASAISEWLQLVPAMNVAGWLRSAVKKFNALAGELDETESIGRWYPASLAGAGVVAALLIAPNPPTAFQAAFDPKKFPAAAIELIRNDPGARVFSKDQWGDYLIYRLYPSAKVFIDGRSDYYGADLGRKTVDAINVRNGWEETLSRFGVNTILLPPSAPLTGALKESRRWRLVHDDGVALVFRPAGGQTDSAAANGGGPGRDREITKTQGSDRPITRRKTS